MAGQLLSVSQLASGRPSLADDTDIEVAEFLGTPLSEQEVDSAVGWAAGKGAQEAVSMLASSPAAINSVGDLLGHQTYAQIGGLLGLGGVNFAGIGISLGYNLLDMLSEDLTGKTIGAHLDDNIGRPSRIAGRDALNWFGETFLDWDNYQNLVATSEAAITGNGLEGPVTFGDFSAYDEFGNPTVKGEADEVFSGFAEDLSGYGGMFSDWGVYSQNMDDMSAGLSADTPTDGGGDSDFDGGWSDNWGDPGDYSQNMGDDSTADDSSTDDGE